MTDRLTLPVNETRTSAHGIDANPCRFSIERAAALPATRRTKGDRDLDARYDANGMRRGTVGEDRIGATADRLRAALAALPPLWRAHCRLSGLARYTSAQRIALRDRLRAIGAPLVADLDTAELSALDAILRHVSNVRSTWRPAPLESGRAQDRGQWRPVSDDDVTANLRAVATRPLCRKPLAFPVAFIRRGARRDADRAAGRAASAKRHDALTRAAIDAAVADSFAAVSDVRVAIADLRAAGRRSLANALRLRAAGRPLPAAEQRALHRSREELAAMLTGRPGALDEPRNVRTVTATAEDATYAAAAAFAEAHAPKDRPAELLRER